MERKIIMTTVLLLTLLLLLSACAPVPPSESPSSLSEDSSSSAPSEQKTPKIGISFPTQSLPRWENDGNQLKEKLEAAGCKVELQFGGDSDMTVQLHQIETMISNGCAVLIIADATQGLSEILKDAKEKEIPIISYEYQLMNTDAGSYHVAFDYTKVGAVQGRYIADQLDLENQEGPFYIELFAGELDDEDSPLFWTGAMEVLQPYIDSGKLAVKSGQTNFQKCTTISWSTEHAQVRMENLTASQGYAPNATKLDSVLSPNDSLAVGITNALLNAGYTADNFPVLTGRDCDVQGVQNIKDGIQSMSVFTNTNELVERTVKMVTSLVNGEEPEVNDRKTYDNGFGPVPSFLVAPTTIVTKDNYKEVLIDSGYYQEWELME